MAIDVLSNISANIPQIFASEGRNLWNREAPLFSKLKKERGISTAVNWTVSNGGNTAVNPGEGDDIQASEYNQDNRLAMTLSRGIYRSSFGFTHTELAVVATLKSDMAADLIRDRLKDAYLEGLAKLANKIEQDMLVGTGTATSPLSNSVNNIVGILSALPGATGTYGGQNVASYTGLQTNKQSAVGNITRAVLDRAFYEIEQQSGTSPDFIMCSPKTAAYIKEIGDTQVRFDTLTQMRELNQYNQAPLSMGRSVTSYNGVPVIQNSAWFQAGGDGYVLLGRLEDFVVNFMPYDSWGDAVTDRMGDLVSSNGERSEVMPGVPVKIYSPAKTGSSVKFAMELELQMKILRPNATALLTGVTGFATS